MKRKAFTLVEILIVICVISILFVVLVSRVDFATDKSRQAGVQNDFHAMQSALHVIALENNSFTGDITQLADELNKNLDSELSVRVENGVIKTDAKDPWGSEYVLEYDKPADTNGRVTLLSPGPDTTLKTQDDIKSEIVIKVDNGKTNIVIDNNPQEIPNTPEAHTCVFNKQVKSSHFVATEGTCITPTTYYYSCSCGSKGTTTFHGTTVSDNHQGLTETQYEKHVDNHNVLTYCKDCHGLISSVPEAHVKVGEECSLCHQEMHEHSYTLEAVSSDYIASSATCENKATYYYSCSCGAKDTSNTFEYGTPLQHNYTSNSTQYVASPATCNAQALYYKTCSRCGAKGTETFSAGSFNTDNHVGGTKFIYVNVDNNSHRVDTKCNSCTKVWVSSSTEKHVFDSKNTCTACNTHVHLFEEKNTNVFMYIHL